MKKIKIEIKWAFIFIATLLVWMLLEKFSGLHSTHIDKHQYLTMLFMIPAILVYVFALRDKKKNDYNGQMSYMQGFVSGMIISAIVTVFSPLTQWIISYVITPEYFPNVIEYSVKTGYYKSLEEAQAYFNYSNYAAQSTIWALIMGAITSAIVAIFTKSKKSTNTNNTI
ncbi:MAG TPA: DUF4199 domain-containing protein [Bacteroidales bacterium]|nr:DUF4199 domain-containing protein [Bacteroidales bacterium]